MAKLGAAVVGDVDGVRVLSPKGLAAGLERPVKKTMTQMVNPIVNPFTLGSFSINITIC